MLDKNELVKFRNVSSQFALNTPKLIHSLKLDFTNDKDKLLIDKRFKFL